jgi:hypothetical protein
MTTRDLIYEQNNIGYDEQYTEETGGGVKCKNYLLCNRVLPFDWFDHYGNYLCMSCDMFEWNELEFRNTDSDCVVFYTHCDIEMKFPTNCNHWFWVDCCRNILFWDETRYHLSPEPYGCPHCPNKCKNPINNKEE